MTWKISPDQLATGNWQLATGNWQLATVGAGLLAIGATRSNFKPRRLHREQARSHKSNPVFPTQIVTPAPA
ncbi:hypothetical protein CDA60_04950 [Pseudomonas fragi]|nr:hypothetical protein CDA60_04950 [Pseudomonas fragi]